jgi:hypothetical protein
VEPHEVQGSFLHRDLDYVYVACRKVVGGSTPYNSPNIDFNFSLVMYEPLQSSSVMED